MGYFQVRYDSKVINYDRRGFIRLATEVKTVQMRDLCGLFRRLVGGKTSCSYGSRDSESRAVSNLLEKIHLQKQFKQTRQSGSRFRELGQV